MLVPLLSVLAALAMGVAAVAIYLQMQEREKRIARERELQLTLAENDSLKSHLQETEQAKAKTEEELTRAKKDLSQSKEELTKAVEAQELLTKSIEDREREINRLTKDLTQAKDEAGRVASQLTGLQRERDDVKRQVADLERAKNQLESKVLELSSAQQQTAAQPTVELDKIFVTNTPPPDGSPVASGTVVPVTASSSAGSAGQVVVVNREYDFVVMNLGKNHGLSIGQEFQVVRGTQVLGKVKVEKVYDELSAAAILPDSQKNSIREGDAVKAL
ncbi:MAG: hypothetical protein HY599_05995 [Candidatus Omnitrophica bacterium]|nr:hypothetical protein [Candidatus Omnitrophota bacterium]